MSAAASFGLLLLAAAPTAAAPLLPESEPPFVAGERNLHLLALPLLDFGPFAQQLPPPGSFDLLISTTATSTWSHSWHPVTVHRSDFGRSGLPFSTDEAAFIHERWPQDAAFLIDGAFVRTSLTLRTGLAAGWSASVEIPWISQGGLRLDRLVEGFHGAFGISDAGRDTFPRDRFLIYLQAPGKEPIFLEDAAGDGFGDLVATLSWRGESRGGWSVGADLAAEAPTGDERALRGSGSWDLGARLALSRDAPPWSCEADLSVVRPGGAGHLPGIGDSPFARVSLSVGRRLGEHHALSLSASWSQSPFRREGLDTLSEDSVDMALGLERRLPGGWGLRAELIENLPLLGGERADIGFALRLRPPSFP
jgi:hypothetical protein